VADPTAAQLKAYAKSGVAMPDQSYYIRNADDLSNAIHAVGRAAPTGDETEIARRNAVRRHIMNRARALRLADQIPDTWNADGSLKHSQAEEFISHLGVKGDGWGIHDQHALERHVRVALGKGTSQDKTQVRLDMTSMDLRRHKGSIRTYSSEQAQLLHARKEHATSGMTSGDLLEHFGRKGMHWGTHVFGLDEASKSARATRKVQGQRDKLDKQATEHERIAKGAKEVADQLHSDSQDLAQHGEHSRLFKANYGDKAHELNDIQFIHRTGGTPKSEAIRRLGVTNAAYENFFREQHSQHTEEGKRIRAQISDMSHDDSADYILTHFGRKGMHWGEHVFGKGSDTTSHISDDAARSQAIRVKIQKHGVASLSNAELQHHVSRLNLEQQHARLTATDSNVQKGYSVVKGILGGAKTGLDAYNTGAQTYKTVQEIRKVVSK
jgi:hypothetical protein